MDITIVIGVLREHMYLHTYYKKNTILYPEHIRENGQRRFTNNLYVCMCTTDLYSFCIDLRESRLN